MKPFIAFVLFFYFTVTALMSFWTDRSLEWLLSTIKETPVEVHGGLSFLLTIVLSPVILAGNIIIEIIRAVW